MDIIEALEAIDQMEKSGDKVTLGYERNGQGRTLPGTFTAAEARVAIRTLVEYDAEVTMISRYEGALGVI